MFYTYNYHISGQPLEKVETFKDLGVTVDSKFTFCYHIDNVINKANKIAGFLKRQTADISDMRVLLMLYSSLVRCILEYGTIVWNPYFILSIGRIEKVQRKFVKYLCFKSNIQYDREIYELILLYLGLPLLEVRRQYYDFMFIFKVLNAIISNAEILQMFKLNASERTVRSPRLLYAPFR